MHMGLVRLLTVLLAAAATLGAAELQIQVVDEKGKPV